jgi:hypothetical protein
MNDQLFSCAQWSIENKTCKCIYYNRISPKYKDFKMNLNDYDIQCNGKSNKSRCVGFTPVGLSEMDYPYYKKQNIKVTKRLL